MLHKSSHDNARSGRFGTAAGSGRGCWRSPGFNCQLRWPRKQSGLAACPQGAATSSPCRCLWVEPLEAKPQPAAEGSTGAFGGFPAGLLALGQATVRAALKREPQQGPSPPKCGLGAPSNGCWPAWGRGLSAQPTTPRSTPTPQHQKEVISGKTRLPTHTQLQAGACSCSQTLPLPLPQNIPPRPGTAASDLARAGSHRMLLTRGHSLRAVPQPTPLAFQLSGGLVLSWVFHNRALGVPP